MLTPGIGHSKRCSATCWWPRAMRYGGTYSVASSLAVCADCVSVERKHADLEERTMRTTSAVGRSRPVAGYKGDVLARWYEPWNWKRRSGGTFSAFYTILAQF